MDAGADLKKPISNRFFSLVIPVYNEEERLGAIPGEALKYVQSNFTSWEIIYVDDGSTDATYARLFEYQRQNPQLRILSHKKNLGKGRAVRTGMEAAKGDLVLFSDVDFSTPIEEVQKLLAAISYGYDIAIGSRGVPGSNVEIPQSKARETIGKIGNAIVQTLLFFYHWKTLNADSNCTQAPH